MKKTFVVAAVLAALMVGGCWENSEEARARNEAFLISNSGVLVVANNKPSTSGCTVLLKNPFREKWDGVSVNIHSVSECQKMTANNSVKASLIDVSVYYAGRREMPGEWLTITVLPTR